jgi:hypothetical protein
MVPSRKLPLPADVGDLYKRSPAAPDRPPLRQTWRGRALVIAGGLGLAILLTAFATAGSSMFRKTPSLPHPTERQPLVITDPGDGPSPGTPIALETTGSRSVAPHP